MLMGIYFHFKIFLSIFGTDFGFDILNYFIYDAGRSLYSS